MVYNSKYDVFIVRSDVHIKFVRIFNYLQTTKDNDGSNGGGNHNATDEHESIAEMSAVNDFVEDLKRNLQASSMSKKK